MDAETFKGQWPRIKDSVQQGFSKLSDSDVGSVGGSLERLIDSVQERYDLEESGAREKVMNWLEKEWGTK